MAGTTNVLQRLTWRDIGSSDMALEAYDDTGLLWLSLQEARDMYIVGSIHTYKPAGFNTFLVESADANGGVADIRCKIVSNPARADALQVALQEGAGDGTPGNGQWTLRHNTQNNRFDIIGGSDHPQNEKFTILDNGNVGIGATNPGAKLDVNGGILVQDTTIGSTNAGVGSDGMLQFTSNANNSATTNDHIIFYTDNFAKELMRITYSGNVGIGATNPGAKLQLSDMANTWPSAHPDLVFEGTGYNYSAGSGGHGRIYSGATAGNWNDSYIRFQTHHTNGTALSDTMTLVGGKVGIGTTSPDAPFSILQTAGSGNIEFSNYAGGGYMLVYDRGTSAYKTLTFTALSHAFQDMSDQRLKTDINGLPSEQGLAGIMQLNPVTFHWKDYLSDQQLGQCMGLIAQEVEKIFPSLVSVNRMDTTIHLADGSKQVVPDVKTLNYEGFIVPLIKAIQELNTQVVKFDSTGHVGIGTTSPSYQLQLSTDSAAKPGTNTWTIASDSRLKKDIRPYTNGLKIIKQINPVWFKYNGKGGFPDDNQNHIGVIGQEIIKVAPYTVDTFWAKLNPEDKKPTKFLNFNSHALTFDLINSVKELDADITKLSQENQELKKADKELKSELENLKTRLSRLEARQR